MFWFWYGVIAITATFIFFLTKKLLKWDITRPFWVDVLYGFACPVVLPLMLLERLFGEKPIDNS